MSKVVIKLASRLREPSVRESLHGVPSVALLAVLASLLISQQGVTMTSAVTSACVSLAIFAVLFCLRGSRPATSFSTLSLMLLLVVLQPAPVGDDLQLQLSASLLVALVLIVIGLGPIRRTLVGCVPDALRVGAAVSLSCVSAFGSLVLCGVVSRSAEGLVSVAGIFDPTFVDSAVSLLATAVLRASGVPCPLLLGLAVAAFAGIPLGLTQAPAGVLAGPDLALASSSLEVLAGGAGRLASRLLTPEGIGLVTSCALCIALSGGSPCEDSDAACQCPSLAPIGTALAALLGIPGLWVEGKTREAGPVSARLGEGVVTLATLAIVCLLSPLVACVPVSAAFGPLLLVSVEPLGRLGGIDWGDVSAALPVIAMVLMTLVTGSLAWSLAAGNLLRVAFDLGSGRGRGVGWVMWLLAVLSFAYLLAITGV